MKPFAHTIAVLVLLAGSMGSVHAANSNLDVNITFTIPTILQMEWGGDAAHPTNAVTWNIGLNATVNSTYETYTPTGGTTWAYDATTPKNLTLKNSGTTGSIDIGVYIQSAGTLTPGAAVGAVNVYRLKVANGAANAVAALDAATTLTTDIADNADWVAALGNGAETGRLDFQLMTPTTIAAAHADVAQTIVVRFTAHKAH